MNIFDWLLYIWFAINILYLLVYSLASRRRDLPLPPPAKEHKRFAILIPAYREDAVIHECVHSCLEQDYPADCFDTVVISDRMQPETNASLAVLPVRLVEVHFEKSTKSKSLNAAMAAIGNDYDGAHGAGRQWRASADSRRGGKAAAWRRHGGVRKGCFYSE